MGQYEDLGGTEGDQERQRAVIGPHPPPPGPHFVGCGDPSAAADGLSTAAQPHRASRPPPPPPGPAAPAYLCAAARLLPAADKGTLRAALGGLRGLRCLHCSARPPSVGCPTPVPNLNPPHPKSWQISTGVGMDVDNEGGGGAGLAPLRALWVWGGQGGDPSPPILHSITSVIMGYPTVPHPP